MSMLRRSVLRRAAGMLATVDGLQRLPFFPLPYTCRQHASMYLDIEEEHPRIQAGPSLATSWPGMYLFLAHYRSRFVHRAGPYIANGD